MTGAKIPDDNRLLRAVSWSRLRKADGTNEVIGINPDAFQLRPDEDSLSATWVEYFEEPTPEQQIHAAVRATRRNVHCSSKSGFALGVVVAIKEACSSRAHQIRVVHEPVDGNDGHAAVRRYPRDDLELQALLAAGAWGQVIFNSAVP